MVLSLRHIKLKVYNVTITQIALCNLLFITILHFFLCHSVIYEHINKNVLVYEFYKGLHTNITLADKVLQCKVETVLERTEIFDTWGEPKPIQIDTRNLINGSFVPRTCNPKFSVAIIAPYRNREAHLDVFISYMHWFLGQQGIHYRIYIAELQDDLPFNRGFLMNVGARQALKDGYPCLILHDISLLPIDFKNFYVCTLEPRHMSVRVDRLRFNLIHAEQFGGAVAIRSDQFIDINGFSSKFDFWGGEDDDLYERVMENHFGMTRYPPDMSRYTAQRQKPKPRNPRHWIIREENRRTQRRGDGLLFLDIYIDELKVEVFPLYTLVGVKRKHYVH